MGLTFCMMTITPVLTIVNILGMALVVFSIQTLDYYVPQDDQQNFIIYTPFHPKSDDS